MKRAINFKVFTAILSIAMMICTGCKKNDSINNDGSGDFGSGTGQVELNGKKYTLNESNVIIGSNSEGSAPYVYMLTLKSSNGNTTVALAFYGSSGSEIATGTYNVADFASQCVYTLDGADLSYSNMLEDDEQLVVSKSGSDFNVTITGTTTTLDNKAYNFKATYNGKIKVIKM